MKVSKTAEELYKDDCKKDGGTRDVITVDMNKKFMNDIVSIIESVIDGGHPLQVLVGSVIGAWFADQNPDKDVRLEYDGGYMYMSQREPEEGEEGAVHIVDSTKVN